MTIRCLGQRQLAHDAADAFVDGALADPQPARDTRIRPAVGHEPQDLTLARGEVTEGVLGAARGYRLFHQSGVDDRAAGGNPTERLVKVARLGDPTLQEVAHALAASEARARELAEEQAALRRVATVVAEGAPPGEVVDAVAVEVGQLIGADFAFLSRYEPGGGVTVLSSRPDKAARQLPVTDLSAVDPASVTGTVLRTGRPARIDDFAAASGPWAKHSVELGYGSAVGAPVTVQGRRWGVMIVTSVDAQHWPPDTEQRLTAFTELLATAIANAENSADLAAAEARSRDLASEQAALRRVATLVARGSSADELFSAVATEVAGIIDIPIVAVDRYEPDGTFTVLGVAGETSSKVGSRWPVEDDGIAGRILATGRPARKDDYTSMTGPLGDVVRKELIRSLVGVPIVVEGNVWGFLVAAAKTCAPIPAGTEDRLARFTELVATAVSNATARTELLASRARVVSAADEARRRLERDLHDGIQQRLIALTFRARNAADRSSSRQPATQELSDLADELVVVTDELREISRGIHPAVLSDAGLDDALKALARRSAIPVELDVSFQGRYDPPLEATVYYVVAESITNAVKHAQASSVTVHGGRRDGALEVEIRDLGVGGADPHRGSGLIGLKDRVDTLGGTISFASPAGAGTAVRVTLPVWLTRPGRGAGRPSR